MIKAYCDRCEKELSDEYLIGINVTTTGWAGNRNETYYSKDFNATNTTRRVFLCVECLNKFSNMVNSFMELQQKGGE